MLRLILESMDEPTGLLLWDAKPGYYVVTGYDDAWKKGDILLVTSVTANNLRTAGYCNLDGHTARQLLVRPLTLEEAQNLKFIDD